MRSANLANVLMVVFAVTAMAACSSEQAVDLQKIMAQPKAYVGSQTCKKCHLEHYDSWKMTMHSRMTQDVQKNRDALIVA